MAESLKYNKFYMFYMKTQVTIRDVDSKVFREFRTEAVARGMKIGTALTLAMEKFQSGLRKKIKFTSLQPISWGIGTERTSEDVDKILYGD